MRSESEIRDKLESLRKQYDESVKNPAESIQDRNNERYFEAFEKRKQQINIEGQLRDEIAILEWVLDWRMHWKTTWMMEHSL